MTMPAEDTRLKILDTAESLFARRGFHGVSLREIMQESSVQLGAINYHFGKKEDLFREVIARRAGQINARRFEILDQAIRRHYPQPPALRDVVDAIAQPLLELSTAGSDGLRSYCILIAQTASNPEWKDLVSDYFDEIARAALAAMQSIYPSADRRSLITAYYFMVGAITWSFARSGRVDRLYDGDFAAAEAGQLYENLIIFASAGVEQVIQAALSKSPGKSPNRKTAAARRPD
jgi:AcrR family transcriptional regulator